MDRRQFMVAGAGAVSAALLGARATRAQGDYPTGPIRLVVPFAAGGVVDAVARHFSEKMTALIGPFVVENQGGAGGLLGAGAVRRAPPDGQTLLFGDTSSLTIAPSMKDSPPYSSADFQPVSMLATSSTSIVVHPSVPAQSLAKLITYAQANPGTLSYGSAGVGTVTHLAGESFKQRAGLTDLNHVPYRGAGPALNDIIAGMIPIATPNITGQVLELQKAGKLRILAVLAPQRLAAAPEIPTASETLPGLVIRLSCGLIAPAGTPAAIVGRLEAASLKVLADPDFGRILTASGLEPWKEPGSAQALSFLIQERDQLLPIIKAAGLKSE